MFGFFRKHQGPKQATTLRKRRKSSLCSHGGEGRHAHECRLTFEALEPRWVLSSVSSVDTTVYSASLVTDPTSGAVTGATAVPKQMEYLDRGVMAVKKASNQIYVSWRLLGTDPSSIAFNLYRSANGGAAVKLNSSPITTTTDYTDTTFTSSQSNSYYVRPVVNGVEQAPSGSYTLAASAPVQQFLSVPLQVPAGVTTPDGVTCTYSANDCSVGDVDGDGQYEIIVKWDPSNSMDPGDNNGGYTGNVYVDCYKLNGTRLWRIDLGINIRAGAHYTQFMVYDLNGDGKAEVAMKTAPGTKDGLGNNVILGSDDPNADYRTTSANGPGGRPGLILTGPEYLTIFNGQTGAAMATTNYLPARGSVNDWGDNYGNRSERYLAAVAYIDGTGLPSLIECRGYYGPKSGYAAKNIIGAWNYRNGTLTHLWQFEAATGEDGNINQSYVGQGDHSLTIADVDGDGKDEIVYGSCVIDDNGSGIYSTGLGHGDSIHVGDFDPTRPGLESWQIHETPNANYGYELHDVATGQIIWGGGTTDDDGRGCADNILAGYVGAQMWSSATSSLYDVHGIVLGSKPSPDNFLVWWDGDLSRELEDGTSITKYSLSGSTTLLSASGCALNNGTKSNPCLVADIFGDWREEVIWRTTSSSELRIYTTTTPESTSTGFRIYTLMDDVQYRESIAWQNVAYNQPAHTSFYLGYGMSAPPTPNIYLAGATHILPVVTDTTPSLIDAGDMGGAYVTQIVVNFNEQLNSSDANAAGNYELRRAVNGIFGDSDDQVYVLTPNYVYNSQTGAITVTLAFSGYLPADTYRLTIRAYGGAGGIRDINGNYLDGDKNGLAGGDYVRTFTVLPVSIAGRFIFYNDSKFDGHEGYLLGDPAANLYDDNAIATNKQALLPGVTASFANYTSYSRGINGIIVNVLNLADSPDMGNYTQFFSFSVSSDGTNWSSAPVPATIDVWPTPGVNNSTRVTIIWADNTIQNEWLKVTVLAGADTGLTANDVFCFGNLMGESGNDAAVNAQDEMAVANNRIGFTLASVTNNYDYNRDRQVNGSDAMIARRNAGASLTMITGLLAAQDNLQPLAASTIAPVDASGDREEPTAAESSTSTGVLPLAAMAIDSGIALPLTILDDNSTAEAVPAIDEGAATAQLRQSPTTALQPLKPRCYWLTAPQSPRCWRHSTTLPRPCRRPDWPMTWGPHRLPSRWNIWTGE